jgi:YD repeat-containing protein
MAGHGMAFLDLFPAPGTAAYNGKPATYYWNYRFTNSNDDVIHNTGNINLMPECDIALEQKMIRIGESNPPSYRISCLKPDEVHQPEINPKSCTTPRIGNPILPSTGVKQQTEVDYIGSGANFLQFSRGFRSDRHVWANNYQAFGIDFTNPPGSIGLSNITWPIQACWPGIGLITRQSSCFRPMNSVNASGAALPNDFSVQRGDGRMLNFGTATDLSPAIDIDDRVVKAADGNGWNVYNAENDSTDHYDLSGRLITVTTRNGQVQTLIYSDIATLPATAPQPGLLLKVSDQFGRSLNFTYDSNSRMQTMSDPAGGIYTYAYDEANSIVVSGNPVGNLTSITYPDGKKRIYWYNEQDKTGNTDLPYALTGITDENGMRFATYMYDSSGKAISTEHAGGVDKYTVSYPNPTAQSVAIDPLGTSRTYSFQTILGVVKSTGQTQPGGAGCGAAASGITYDANGNVATRTDFNGTVTTFSYDLTRNLETSRVEASGTVQSRTITTAWHATYRLPLKIAEPKLLTTYAYDASGNLLSKTVQATSDATGTQGLSPTLVGTARTWSYTYNSVGQVLTAAGPRTDVADKTTYTYDTSGNLSMITNAVGQITTLSNYDANGRAGLITDANGATTALTYSPRGWLTGKTVTSGGTVETTTYAYDGVGQLTLVTLPDTSTVSYTYDPAHRLTNIADSLGNGIAYTLDNMGNRISEQVKDPGGALARQTSRVVDALNRLQQITGAVQ